MEEVIRMLKNDKVRTAADSARPYLERALTDEEFRESLRMAFLAAKRFTTGSCPPRA